MSDHPAGAAVGSSSPGSRTLPLDGMCGLNVADGPASAVELYNYTSTAAKTPVGNYDDSQWRSLCVQSRMANLRAVADAGVYLTSDYSGVECTRHACKVATAAIAKVPACLGRPSE